MSDSQQPHEPPSPWQAGGPPAHASQPQGPADQFPTVPIPAAQPPVQSTGQPPVQSGGQPPPPFQGEVPTYDRGEPGGGRRTVALAAVIALVVGLGAGFAVGRQTAPEGATSLAQAIQLSSAGKLPTGDLSSVRGNLGGAFRRGSQGGNGQAAPGAGGQGNGNANGNGGATGNGGGFLFGGGQRNRGIQATVNSISGDTLTLDTPAGQLRVRIGPNTRIQKATTGARSDITQGSRVVVNFDLGGATNNDGSVSASSILAEGQSQ
jgi:hypothetical protein